jgi:ribosomal protein S18 acetylase RimI-like enzyme
MTTIRPISKDDIPAVSRLLCDCYRWLGQTDGFGAEYVEFLVTQRGSIETIERESAVENYLVACVDDEIVGMVSIKSETITKLYVDPKWHRQGIGVFLFEVAEEIIAREGHQKLTLGTLGESPVPFYMAMGMTVVGYKDFPERFHLDKRAVLMEKVLTG